jgi:hypothetical protein
MIALMPYLQLSVDSWLVVVSCIPANPSEHWQGNAIGGFCPASSAGLRDGRLQETPSPPFDRAEHTRLQFQMQ